MTATFRCGSSEWAVEDLWKAAEGLPIKDVKVSSLLSFLDDSVWSNDAGDSVSPIDTMDPEHWDRINSADLSYPIIFGYGGCLMDGFHRLMKAWLLDHDTIKTVTLVKLPDCLED
jgi:hypothetical protein